MSRFRHQDGQTAAEYLGLIVVVAAIVVAIGGAGLPAKLAGGLAHQIDCLVGGGSCESSPHAGGTPANPVTPLGVGGSSSGAVPVDTGGVPEPSEPVPGEAPVPFPPKPAPSSWTGQASNLPAGGERPYVPPKGSHGKPLKVPAGNRGGKKGYKDANGNVWTWNPPGSATAHGGPHWDVTHPDGSHTNVGANGEVTHGPDNFPNTSRPGGGSSSDGGGDSNDYTAEAAAGAGILATIGAIWWGAKVASPACGPFVIVCAVVL